MAVEVQVIVMDTSNGDRTLVADFVLIGDPNDDNPDGMRAHVRKLKTNPPWSLNDSQKRTLKELLKV